MCVCVCERLLKTNNLFDFNFYVNNQCGKFGPLDGEQHTYVGNVSKVVCKKI